MGRRDHPERLSGRKRPLSDGALFIRPFTPSDCNATYLCWLRDPEVTRFIRFATPGARAARRYVTEALGDPDARFFAVCLHGRKIGTIKLAPIDWAEGTAEVGLMIGAKRVWGRGYGRRAILLACRWAFERLHLRVVTAGIDGANVASVKAFERAGFEMRYSRSAGAWRCLKEAEDGRR